MTKLVPDLFVAVTVSLEEAFRRNPPLKNKAEQVSNHNALFESFYSSYKGSKAYLDTSSLSKDGVVDSALNLIYSNIPELSLSIKKSPEHEERQVFTYLSLHIFLFFLTYLEYRL